MQRYNLRILRDSATEMNSAHIWRRTVLVLALSLCFVVAPSALGQAVSPPATAETAESHLGKGYDALKQDRYQVAADEFRAALALDPSLVLRAQFPLAVALF